MSSILFQSILFHAILRHGANDPEPDFKVRVHVQARSGDPDVVVPLAPGDRQLYKLLSGVCDVFTVGLAPGGGLQRGNEQAQPHECYRLYRTGAVDIQLNNFTGCFINFLKIKR